MEQFETEQHAKSNIRGLRQMAQKVAALTTQALQKVEASDVNGAQDLLERAADTLLAAESWLSRSTDLLAEMSRNGGLEDRRLFLKEATRYPKECCVGEWSLTFKIGDTSIVLMRRGGQEVVIDVKPEPDHLWPHKVRKAVAELDTRSHVALKGGGQ